MILFVKRNPEDQVRMVESVSGKSERVLKREKEYSYSNFFLPSPDEGVQPYVGDPMPYYEDGTYYIYYLKESGDSLNHSIYLTKTRDFCHYEEKEEALITANLTGQDEWVGTGSLVKTEDRYLLFYTGHGEAVNWWLDQMPFEDKDYPLTFFGYSGVEFPDFKDPYDVTARDHSWNTSINIPFESTVAMRDHLEGKLLEAGAEIMYETPVVQLITDEAGNVVGAYAKNADGYIKFNTAKGVVLSTGGYEHNLKKLKECCRPRDLQLCGWLTYARNCTGDGHEMAKAIGAMEDEYPHPLMLDPMQLMPYVRVNSQGKRFIGEYETYDHLASAMQTQYGGYDYFLTDANAMEAVEKMWSPSSSCYGPKEVWVGAATSPNALTADTLEELAEKMGVPVDNFVATINRWNEMCDAGEDTDYGYPGDKMHRIDTAPFYATREMAEALATSGGLQVNEFSQVLNTANQPIQGLFAIGNTSGSMFYGTYPHSMNCLSHTRCVVFGYNIGKFLGE